MTGPPNAFDKSPELSAKFNKILRVAVAADEASNPALLSCESKAAVSSREKPKDCATGATIAIAVPNPSNSNALLFKVKAITSATCSISEASN